MMMLRPDWARTVEFSPVVGLNQGLFKLATDAGAGNRTEAVLVDAGGQQLALTAGGSIQRGAAPSSGGGFRWKRSKAGWGSNIARIKATPSSIRPLALQSADQLMTGFAKAPSSEIRVPSGGITGVRRRAPFEPGDAVSAPAMPPDVRRAAFDPPSTTPPRLSEYVTLGPKPNLPIAVNNFPDSFSPWSPKTSNQMSKWNYYASGVFQVYTTPTPNYAWGDNVFDLAGWPDSATLQSIYGSPWGGTTIGVCFTRSIGATIVEADIALNPAFSFTLNDESVY